jgi:hypothetical protein
VRRPPWLAHRPSPTRAPTGFPPAARSNTSATLSFRGDFQAFNVAFGRNTDQGTPGVMSPRRIVAPTMKPPVPGRCAGIESIDGHGSAKPSNQAPRATRHLGKPLVLAAGDEEPRRRRFRGRERGPAASDSRRRSSDSLFRRELRRGADATGVERMARERSPKVNITVLVCYLVRPIVTRFYGGNA